MSIKLVVDGCKLLSIGPYRTRWQNYTSKKGARRAKKRLQEGGPKAIDNWHFSRANQSPRWGKGN